jgi:hypothetical protein
VLKDKFKEQVSELKHKNEKLNEKLKLKESRSDIHMKDAKEAHDKIVEDLMLKVEKLQNENTILMENMEQASAKKDNGLKEKDEMLHNAQLAIEELKEQLMENQSLLPSDEEEAKRIKEMSMEEPLYIFDRMRQVLAELTFLTDLMEDNQFEENQEVLAILMQDYTQLVELAMSRGLVQEEMLGSEDPR